jgi:hypothetical protein
MDGAYMCIFVSAARHRRILTHIQKCNTLSVIPTK